MAALLVGHEDWVFSAAWQPRLVAGTAPCLLTASMDRTMMLWRPEPSAGVHSLIAMLKQQDIRSCKTCDLATFLQQSLRSLQVLYRRL